MARRAVEVAEDKQATDIVLLDISGTTTIADYFVILTGTSDRQVRALLEELDKALHEAGTRLLRREGTPESGWVLLDYGSVILHIFAPAQREQYRLERLWDKATPVVRIQ